MINSYISQVDRIAGQLHFNGMSDISIDDLRSLSGSLQAALDTVHREIYRRIEIEQEKLPRAANAAPGGLLDFLKPSNPGGTA
ncbi:hypothetical protein [Bradyrhizobium elkanii]